MNNVQDHDKFVLRLPEGMRTRIKATAEANNRSMNAEMIYRIEQSFCTVGDDVPTLLRMALAKLEG